MGKIILCGPSASGKDYARKTFEQKGFTLGVSYTTRDSRPGEVDGEDYNFMSREQFTQWIKEDKWLEYDSVDNEVDGEVVVDYYGTSKDQFDKFDLFIMTPGGIKAIPEEYQNNFIVIAFDIDKDVRTERMNKREGWTLAKTNTRLEWEKEAFKEMPSDIKIKNKDF